MRKKSQRTLFWFLGSCHRRPAGLDEERKVQLEADQRSSGARPRHSIQHRDRAPSDSKVPLNDKAPKTSGKLEWKRKQIHAGAQTPVDEEDGQYVRSPFCK